jgi:hypothetical protein
MASEPVEVKDSKVRIGDVEYNAKCVSERSLFFRAVLAANGGADIPVVPFNCMKHFNHFMKALTSPKLSIECEKFSEFMSMCYLAAYYDARGFLTSLCSWLASTLADMAVQRATIIRYVVGLDLPRLRRGRIYSSESVLSTFALQMSEGQNRVDHFDRLISDFFRRFSSEEDQPDFNWEGLCDDGTDQSRLRFTVSLISTKAAFWNDDNVCDKLTLFMNYLTTLKIETDRTQLPTTVDFQIPLDHLCSVKRGQKVFVRQCYKDIWDLMQKHAKAGRRCDLTGTPGLGKSVFGIYLLYQLANSDPKRPIVLCSSSWGHFVAEYDGEWRCKEYDDEYSDVHTDVTICPYVIIDGLDPVYHRIPTIRVKELPSKIWFVIGSPKCHVPRATGHNQNEGKVREWYLPLWDQKEFNSFMNEAVNLKEVGDFTEFVDTHGEIMRKFGILPSMKRTEVFGLNPRNVFFNTAAALRNLNKVLSVKADIRKCFASSRDVEVGPTDACHRIVLLKPNEKLENATPIPATAFIFRLVCDVLAQDGIEALREMIRSMRNWGAELDDRSMFGGLYERLCHEVLKAKGNEEFLIEELGRDGKERVGDLMRISLRPWTEELPGRFSARALRLLKIVTGRYYWPTGGSSLPCLDSFAHTGWDTVETKEGGARHSYNGMIGFQMTLAKSHWVAFGKAARAEFVNFVSQAMNGFAERADQGTEGTNEQGGVTDEDEDGEEMDAEAETEGDILPNEQRGTGEREPWFIFVVPEMKDFVGLKIQKTIDAEFRAALGKVRFFVMEVPFNATKHDHNKREMRPNEKAREVKSATPS